jgi:lysozyme
MTDAQIDDLIELNGKGSANYTQVAQLSKKYSRFFDPNTAFAMAVRTAEAKPYLTVTDRESVTPGIDMSGTGIRDNEQFTKYIESVEKYKKVNVLGVVRVGDQVVLSLSGDNNVVTSVTHIQKWAADQAKIEKGEKEFENLIVNPIAHINSREGFSHKMYKDSLGNDTIGFGTHINPKDEKGKRRLAIINARVDKKITREMAEEWRNEDYKEANIAARKLGWSYGIRDTRFINALSVVNYQMGNSAIELKFPSVHKLLKSKDEDRFINAAKIIKESLWMKQTPVRATDFMNALIRMQRE